MAKTIAVTGKGGTGKTVTAALMIRYLKKHADGPVLALDADPDANLAGVLGIKVEKTIGDLREETLANVKSLPAGMSKSNYIEAGLHQIVVETDKLDLIAMGRAEGPGCYCYVNNLLRQFADKLQDCYEWVVVDNEAGLEHLSRRTASRIDHLVVVVNDNPLSIDCAARIATLVSDLRNEVTHRHLLVNATAEERVESVLSRTAALQMEVLGAIPRDSALEQCIFDRKPILDLENTPSIQSVDEIMTRMMEA